MSSRKQALITTPISKDLMEYLANEHELIQRGRLVGQGLPMSEQELIEEIPGKSLLVYQLEVITDNVIEASDLEMLICMRGGGSKLSTPAMGLISERGIPVIYTPGRNASSVAQYALAQIINTTRNISLSLDMIENEQVEVPQGDPNIFDHQEGFLHPTNRLTGKRALWLGKTLEELSVGIIGYGSVGKELTTRLEDCRKVYLCTKHPENHDISSVDNAEFVPRWKLLSEADVVVIAHNDKEYVFGKADIDFMRPSSVVINVSKPSLVNIEDVIDGLYEGQLKSAVLDSIGYQQVKSALDFNSEMRELDRKERIFLTGYIAGSTNHEIEVASRIVLDSLKDKKVHLLHEVKKDRFEESVSELIAVAEFLAAKGYLQPGASSGNISMRNPSNHGEMIVTYSGESLDRLTDSSFCRMKLDYEGHDNGSIDWNKWDLKSRLLDHKGRDFLEPGHDYSTTSSPSYEGKKASFEAWLHSEILRNIDGANSVVHLHPPYATAFASINPKYLSELIEECSYSFPEGEQGNVVPYVNVARAIKCGKIVWVPDFPAASDELHDYVHKVLYENKAVAAIMQNHGLVTIGTSPMKAAYVAAEIEQELGIIMGTLNAIGKLDSVNCLNGKDVAWYWNKIGKGGPWKEVYR